MKNISDYDVRHLGLTVSTRRLYYRTLALFYFGLGAILLFFSIKIGLYFIFNNNH